jgi:putative ABC transport system permease protein
VPDAGRFARWLAAAHRRLLTCYPPAFRAEFGDEAQAAFEARLAAARARGRWPTAVFVVVGLIDVPLSGWGERFRRPRPARGRAPQGDSIMMDVRVAFRVLRRAPGLTLFSVAALGVGIGVTTAMFGVVDAVLLKPLPYEAPDRLVRLRGGQSYLDLQDLIAQAQLVKAFGGFRPQTFDRVTPSGAERLPGAFVTGELFGTLGIRPAMGRLIDPNDDRPGEARVIVISHGLWQRQFGGRLDIVGQSATFGETTYRIIGVLPPDFAFPLIAADVVAAVRAESNEVAYRGVHSLTGLARLGDGVTAAAAQTEMDGVSARLAAQYPGSNRDVRFVLQSFSEWLAGRARSSLLLLFGAVTLVWLIACANVANLQVGRAVGRREEMAVRRAMGATRPRLVRQLLVEHLAVAVAAGLVGTAVAWWCVRMLAGFALDGVPRIDQVAVDLRLVAFATLSAALTTVLFGLAPALAATRTPGAVMGHGGRVKRGGRALVGGLLTAEVALTLALTIGGGLLLTSYARLMRINPGFDPDRLLTFNLTLRPLPRLPPAPTPEESIARTVRLVAERTQYFDQVLRAVAALPGVTAVAASTDLPIAPGSNYHNLTIEGRPVEEGREPEVYFRGVNPGFFRALGVAVRRGREFSADDRGGAAPVGVVNEAFVRRHFPDEDPIGRRMKWGGDSPWFTIVGVVADVKSDGLDADEVAAVYAPFAQDLAVWRRSLDVAVRTSGGDAAAMAAPVRRAIASVDPSIPATRMQTMAALIDGSTVDRRLALALLTLFAAIALVLVIIGLYGSVASAVRMRTQEFGVRLALGAKPGDVVRLALRHAWWCTAAGTALGLAVAIAGARVLTSLLFEVPPIDVLTYALASTGVVAIATLAAAIPAARAARIDPVIVLRRI